MFGILVIDLTLLGHDSCIEKVEVFSATLNVRHLASLIQ